MNPRNIIFYVTAFLVLALALAAFSLSYGAVYDLALFYMWPGWAALISPLMLDAVVVVAKMDILRRSLSKVGTRYPWILVLIFSGLAVLFNVLHATPSAWTPSALGRQLFAALPPIVVLLAFHLFIEQVKDRLAAPVKALRPRVETRDNTPNVQPETEAEAPPLDKANAARQIAADRRAAIPHLVAEGMSPADLAGHFGVATKTIRRDLAALNGQVKDVR